MKRALDDSRLQLNVQKQQQQQLKEAYTREREKKNVKCHRNKSYCTVSLCFCGTFTIYPVFAMQYKAEAVRRLCRLIRCMHGMLAITEFSSLLQFPNVPTVSRANSFFSEKCGGDFFSVARLLPETNCATRSAKNSRFSTFIIGVDLFHLTLTFFKPRSYSSSSPPLMPAKMQYAAEKQAKTTI